MSGRARRPLLPPWVPVIATALVATGGPWLQPASAGRAAPPFRGTLRAVVASSGSLSLTRNGQPVILLRQGVYRVVVSDRTSANDFRLREDVGRLPGDALSGISFVGTQTTRVYLEAGQWMFYSSVHPRATTGWFVVANY